MGAYKIVVLNDGETWAGGGQILTITADAHEALCNGEKEIKHLTDADILRTLDLDMDPWTLDPKHGPMN